MININELNQYWDKLLGQFSNIESNEYKVIETDLIINNQPILLGFDTSFHRHVLIEVPNDSKIMEDRKSEGVKIISHELMDQKTLRKFIDIACLMNNLYTLFSYFLIELLNQIEKNPKEINKTCLVVLSQWRNFFHGNRNILLSEKQLAGLFGELWFLKKLVQINPNVLEYWTGPEASRFDFDTLKIALEIKTTLNKKGRFFKISGIDQLDCPPDKKLYLAALKIEKIANGISIPELVLSILNIIPNKAEFLSKLCNIGYDYYNQTNYENIKFNIINNEERIYYVDDDFPKITPKSFVGDNLPNKIISLKYEIDLSSEPPNPLDEQSKDQLIINIANG